MDMKINIFNKEEDKELVFYQNLKIEHKLVPIWDSIQLINNVL